jgi:hypothetical protein
MYQLILKNPVKYFVLCLAVVLLAIGSISPDTKAYTTLSSRSDQLSNSGTGAVSTHLMSFSYTNTTTPVGSVSFTFCANDPIIGDPCTYPTGLDLTNVVLSAQTGETGFAITSNIAGNGQIIISRNPANPGTELSSYQFDNVINPTSPGSYYVRIQTYSSIDGSGPEIDQGGTVFAIVPSFSVTAIVPPYLTFCAGVSVASLNCDDVSGDQINFGNFSSNNTATATSQFLTATNAGNGYSVIMDGGTLTSGNNTIASLSTPTVARKGVSQFGINLVANSILNVGSDPAGTGTGVAKPNYSQPNSYTFNDGDTIASSPSSSNFSKFTVSYVVNVSSSQPSGVYATTIDYICLANF